MSYTLAPNPYTSLLNPESRKVRLLRLSTSSGGSITCTSECHDLDNAPTFQALSYEWGPATPAHESPAIVFDGTTVTIRRNLWLAVKMILSSPDLLGGLYWIDALSINQRDTRERNTQVGLMKDIYSTASRTLAWLGPENLEPDFIRKMESCQAQDFSSESLQSVVHNDWHDFLKRSYWTRVWIIQEIIASQDLFFVAGSTAIEGNVVERVLLPNSHQAKANKEEKCPETKVVSHRPTWCLKGKPILQARLRWRLQKPLPLFELMGVWIGSQECTELKDKVFALLNVAYQHEGAISVDYERPIEEIFRDVVHGYIEYVSQIPRAQRYTVDHIASGLELDRENSIVREAIEAAEAARVSKGGREVW